MFVLSSEAENLSGHVGGDEVYANIAFSGQPGGGVQMLPNFPDRVNADWLLKNGYLKETTKR